MSCAKPIFSEMKPRKPGRSTIEISPELQEQFAAWCGDRGRKIAPTAAAILKWFLSQETLVQAFILAEPEVANRLSDALMKMSMKARGEGIVTTTRRGGGGTTEGPHQQHQQSARR